MYRTRLGGGIEKAVGAYVSSVSEDSRIVRYDILGSIAHVIMLRDRGLVGRADAGRILGALHRISRSGLPSGGGAEDVHELLEEAVARRAGGAGGRMHTARSRNDQVALDIRMRLRDDINALAGLALDLAEAQIRVASRHAKTVMPLYTHLQQAQYGTLSHYMISHADALLRDVGRLEDAYARTDQCPLGAGAVGGTSLAIDRRRAAGLLGFARIVENSIDATSSRDYVAEYASAVAIMMTGLSRLAEDLVIWSTSEFSFVELGDSVSSPSSVMPQKKNPDVLEITRGRAAETIGALVTILAGSKGLATGYGRDLQVSKPAAWAATDAASGALAAMRLAVLGMKVDAGRMAEAAGSGYLDALEIAEALVQDSGAAFREAHGVVARLVRAAHGSGVRLGELGDAALAGAARGTGLSAAALRAAMAGSGAREALKRRRSAGSSGFAEQTRMIRARRGAIAARRRALRARERRISSAYSRLERTARAASAR